jgi:dephospho-CoA kinase
MLNVGLTGNIAAGKSTVVGLFRRWGATIIDADELVREAEAPGSQVLAAIVQRFGKDVLAADGSLDRAALRAKVMGDDAALSALNLIVHPAVQRRREELQREALARGDALVVNDIPLLFEALDPTQFAVVVLVDAPDALRRTRLRAMRGLSNDDADRMLAAQMSSTKKRDRSQFVIENAGTLAELEARVRTVFRELRRRAATQGLGETRRVPASITLAADNAQDEPPTLAAISARYEDAGVTVDRVAGRAAIRRAIGAARKPEVIVATAGAADEARAAWEDAGRPGVLLFLSEDPDPVAVRLDLRPWGGGRILLGDAVGAGLAARADVFPPPTD